jgi:ABC-type oligopeptide transport system substrate-binding subunit
MKCFIQPVENVDLANNYAGDGMFFNKNGQIISGKGKKNTLGAKATDDDIFVADLNTPCPNTCGN